MTPTISKVCTSTVFANFCCFLSLLATAVFCKIHKKVSNGESPLSHSLGLALLADLYVKT